MIVLAWFRIELLYRAMIISRACRLTMRYYVREVAALAYPAEFICMRGIRVMGRFRGRLGDASYPEETSHFSTMIVDE